LTAIYLTRRKMLRSIAQKIVGPDAAEDVVGDIYAQYYESGAPVSYVLLRQATYQGAVDALRHARLRRHQSIDERDDEGDTRDELTIDRAPSPERITGARRRVACVERAVEERLAPGERAVVLRIAAGAEVEEVARELNTSSGAVRVRLFKARKKIVGACGPGAGG